MVQFEKNVLHIFANKRSSEIYLALSWGIIKSMANSLTPRQDVYDIYWYFAAERQSIFEKRLSGQTGPWSNDPILQEYKFCNVYRAVDRVSQYMIRNVCYNKEDNNPTDRLFQIIAFRIFSSIETWKLLEKKLGSAPTIDNLVDGSFEQALNDIKKETSKLYTGAFILCATNAYGRQLKHLNHVELFKDMFINQDLGSKILKAKSLKQIYDLIHSFPLMGDFMSYQIAIDLNYSDLVNFSENEFTKAGPGALRGIKKVFEDTGGLSPEEVIMWMIEHQDEEFKRLGYNFKGLFGRPLHAIDAQGLFCETDKYCREAVPGLKSARSRIKTHYKKNLQPIELFFPPKWGVNETVLASRV